MKNFLGFVVVILFAFALIVFFTVGPTVAYNAFVLGPYQQEGYSGQVQGLITEYCTAPRAVDKEGARQQLDNIRLGDPSGWHALPYNLSSKASEVIQRQPDACA